MQLETNSNHEVASLKKETKILSILLGALLIIVPILIAVLFNFQGAIQAVKMHFGEIAKNAIIGVAALPVMIYIGIKTNGKWYTKKWAWAVIILLLIVMIATVFVVGGKAAMPPNLPTPMDGPAM